MQLVAQQFTCLVLPTLVPIYKSKDQDASQPDQIGTGFILKHNSRPMLITAKHTLVGHDGNDDASGKAFFNNGKWVYVGDDGSKVFQSPDHDIACFYADTLADRPCLESRNIETTDAKLITIGGYLARDFKRADATLQPKPYIFTNLSAEVSGGLVGLQYRRSKVKSTNRKLPQTAPIPRGLSGGPMLNSLRLVQGHVSLVGVFTEQDSGTARGEPSTVLQQILNAA
ncbi:MAG: hypothetical protein P1U50_13950 [Parvibaculaceae bacterium]|nr:hypothetical protein [Parvibaculaceae bacterium]